MSTKSLVQAVVIAVALGAPIASFAQSSEPLTRAQVRAELQGLETAGFKPASNEPQYPADRQAAEAVVAAKSSDVAQASTQHTGFGSATAGSSESGTAAHPARLSQDIFFGR